MNKRNDFLDFLKYFAAVGIILVHSKFPGVFGYTCSVVVNVGVRLFFLISGYACYGPKEEMTGRILKRIKRNGIFLLVTVAAYFVFACLMRYLFNIDFAGFTKALCAPKTYLRMIVLGDFDIIFGIPLWFMTALLLGYLFMIPIVRSGIKKAAAIALVPLFLIRFAAVTYVVSTEAFSWHFTANVLIDALPMMLLGYVVAIYKDKIKISNDMLLFLVFSSLILSGIFANFRVFGLLVFEPFRNLCIAALFVFAVMNPGIKVPGYFAKLGREDSRYIYLFHYMIIFITTFFVIQTFGNSIQIQWIMPLINIAVTAVIARLISVISKAVRNRASCP